MITQNSICHRILNIIKIIKNNFYTIMMKFVLDLKTVRPAKYIYVSLAINYKRKINDDMLTPLLRRGCP